LLTGVVLEAEGRAADIGN